MRELEIADDVEYLFQQYDLGMMMHTPRPAYRKETIQFLSSLELHLMSRNGGLGFITIKVSDQEYSMTTRTIEALLGLPSGNGTKQRYDKDELHSLWATIGYDKVFSSSRSKSSHIRSPVLRYFHKSLANVFFARNNAGTIVNGEMELMDMALKDLLFSAADGTELKGDSTSTSLAYVLVNQLLSYKKWVLTLQSKGTNGLLCVGGLVTVLLEACRVPLQSEPIEFQWIDVDYLQHTHSLRKARVDGKLVYNFIRPTLADSQILLPCEHLTSFSEPGSADNIEFNPPEESMYKTRARNAGTLADVQDTGITDAPMETDEDQPEYSGEGYAPEKYYFEEFREPRQGKGVVAAHSRLNSLQQWNKAQDKALKAQDKELRAQKKEIKSLKSWVKNLMKKLSCSSSTTALHTSAPSPVRQSAYETEEHDVYVQVEQHVYEQPAYVQEEQPVYEQPEYAPEEQLVYETEVQVPFATPARHSSYQHGEQEYVPIPARASAYEPRERKRRSVKRKHKRQGSTWRESEGPSSEHPPHDL